MTKKNGMTMTDVVEMFCSDMHELQERLQMDEVDVILSLPQTVSTDYPPYVSGERSASPQEHTREVLQAFEQRIGRISQ